jgi:hypothetical protein
MKSSVWVLCTLLTSGFCLAQQPIYTPPQTQQPEGQPQPTDPENPETVEPIQVPLGTTEPTRSLAPQTFVDDVFRSTRNHWGFLVSGNEGYSTDVSTSAEPKQDSAITALTSRVFFNLGKRKSVFHLDAGAGYRFYNNQGDLNSWDYYGTAEYGYQFSKRASFQVSDQFTSSYNDSWSFISLSSPLSYSNTSSSSEVLFNRQRITRNGINADFRYQLSRKASFGVQGGYDFYLFTENTLTDSSSPYVGGNFGYQFAKWLNFSFNYSHYFYNADNQNNDARISSLRIGSFDFKLSRGWNLWFGGGIDYANYQNDTSFGESVDAGIGYTSRDMAFNVRYNRGFTSAIGLARLMKTDNVNTEFSYRFTNRTRAWVESYYYRSADQSSAGVLKTYAGGAGFEFAVRQNLFLTLSSFLQNQRESNVPASGYGLGLNRLTAYVGLQYVWPKRKRADYESAPSAGPSIRGRSW